MRRIVLLVTVLVAIVSVIECKKVKLMKAKNCNRRCRQTSHPVCGSDGVHYSNKCEFKNAQCSASKQGKKLLIQPKGTCGNGPIKITPPKTKKASKRGARCPDNTTHCKSLNSSRNAVCGSNNITYHTFCHFKVAKCRAAVAGQVLSLQYKGVCGKPKRRVVCPQLSQCHNRNSPVCGGDGQTYRNLCHFLVAKCTARKDKTRLKFKYRGACGNPTTPKPCPKKCPKNKKPVCGSDGKTYKNGCVLAAVKCKLPKGQKRRLRLRYRGPCGAPTTAKPCLTERKCRHKRSPVCGSDGVTYRSKCHLRVVKCQAKRNKRSAIVLKYTGPCRNHGNGIGH